MIKSGTNKNSILCSYLAHFLAQARKIKKSTPKKFLIFQELELLAVILKFFLYFGKWNLSAQARKIKSSLRKFHKLREMKLSSSNILGNRNLKKNGNLKKNSYILGNGNPKKLIFQEITFWDQKWKNFLYSRRQLANPENQKVFILFLIKKHNFLNWNTFL